MCFSLAFKSSAMSRDLSSIVTPNFIEIFSQRKNTFFSLSLSLSLSLQAMLRCEQFLACISYLLRLRYQTELQYLFVSPAERITETNIHLYQSWNIPSARRSPQFEPWISNSYRNGHNVLIGNFRGVMRTGDCRRSHISPNRDISCTRE